MTESSAFFGARRGVGPLVAGPQTAGVRRACQRRQIEQDLAWKRRLSGECQLKTYRAGIAQFLTVAKGVCKVLTIPTVDDWYRLSLKYRQFHRASNTVLKDYGYMAIMDYLDSDDAITSWSLATASAQRCSSDIAMPGTSGALMTIKVPPASARPTGMRGKKSSIKKSDLRPPDAPSAAGSWVAAAAPICLTIISTSCARYRCLKRYRSRLSETF